MTKFDVAAAIASDTGLYDPSPATYDRSMQSPLERQKRDTWDDDLARSGEFVRDCDYDDAAHMLAAPVAPSRRTSQSTTSRSLRSQSSTFRLTHERDVKKIVSEVEAAWHHLLSQSLQDQYRQAVPHRHYPQSTPEAYKTWMYARRALVPLNLLGIHRQGQTLFGEPGMQLFSEAFARAQQLQRLQDERDARPALPLPQDWLVLRNTKQVGSSEHTEYVYPPEDALLEPLAHMRDAARSGDGTNPRALGLFNLTYFFGDLFASHQDDTLVTSVDFLALGYEFVRARMRIAKLAGSLSYAEACMALPSETRLVLDIAEPLEEARVPNWVPTGSGGTRSSEERESQAFKQQQRIERAQQHLSNYYDNVKMRARFLAYFAHTEILDPYEDRRKQAVKMRSEAQR